MHEVPTLNDFELAFGSIKHLPPMSEIPDRFSVGSNTFQNEFIAIWFFMGLRSFEPKHEHKETGAAFLLFEWFEEPLPKNDK
jgi:hypothetical protein